MDRTARSKQKMVQALLVLMDQYDYREITVTQIAQEARLSRKTFYRLFSGKDEILDLFFAAQAQAWAALLQARDIHHYWDAVQAFFDFWEQRRDLLALLEKNGLLQRAFQWSYRCSVDSFAQIRSRETAAALALPLPYLLAYSVGGMHAMLLKWAEMGMAVPSSVLIETLKSGFLSPDL